MTFRSITSKAQWISVLKLATSWHCSGLRKLAIERLGAYMAWSDVSVFPPSQKIDLGRKYYVSTWVEAGYAAVVKQGNLTDAEVEEIGPVLSCSLFRIMLDNQKQSLDPKALKERIKQVFEAELQAIVEIENSYQTRIVL